MIRYLVVANQTATSAELIDKLRELSQLWQGETEFVVLVPATPVHRLLIREESSVREVAQRRLAEVVQVMRRAGLKVSHSLLGSADPLSAIAEAIDKSDGAYDAIVISTFPSYLSRWLRSDLPRQAKEKFNLPVIHVVAKRPLSGAWEEVTTTALAGRTVAGTAEPVHLSLAATWRGSNLWSSDGQMKGRVVAVLYEYRTRAPLWLGVSAGPFGVRTLLVPIASVYVEGSHLRTTHSSLELNGQPHVDVGEGLDSLIDQRDIFAYFGLEGPEDADMRVLHIGQDLPGLYTYSHPEDWLASLPKGR